MISNDFYTYFSACTVGILSGRNVIGTGFFAAPGRVITCAHVVAALGKRVDIRWNKLTFSGEVEKAGNPKSLLTSDPGASPDPDLAVIRLEQAAFGPETQHPCVYLSGETPRIGDSFYAYGHAEGEYAENGEAVTLAYEGPANDAMGRTMLNLKAGNVLPGMSGSPLLNLRTGRVNAVLFVTRGAGLGGRGIPISFVLEMIPDLAKPHDEYHEKSSRWVELWTGTAPAPAAPPSVPTAPKGAEQAFTKKKIALGVWAERLHIEKRPNLFGDSLVRYRIENLQSESRLLGIAIQMWSAVGSIGVPKPEDDSQDAIVWQGSLERDLPQPLDRKIEELRTLRGRFAFKTALQPGGKISFGWSVQILNQYALSDWEFWNMYGPEARHFDLSLLSEPMEYFPQVVWFPVEYLTIRLALPPSLPSCPSLSVYQCRNQARIQTGDVVRQGWLEMHPREDSCWMTDVEGRWVPDNVEADKRARNLIVNYPGPGISTFDVRYPRVGWCYSLDWPLPITLTQVVRDAEKLRQALRAFGACCRNQTQSVAANEDLHEKFREFAEDLRREYSTESSEAFEVTLMTYDADIRKLIVVDGFRNGNDLNDSDWNFALPFGTGLAGACFREGNQAICWLRREQESRFNYYLPITEKEQHQALLLIPIDHPSLPLVVNLPVAQERSGAFSERAQQVIAILVVASDAEDTKLLRLSTSQEDLSGEAVKRAMSELAKIAEKARELGAAIAEAVQRTRP